MGQYLFGKKEIDTLILGFDGAGKSTMIEMIKKKENQGPRIGFAMESVNYRNLKLTAFDFGGMEKLRLLFRTFYASAQAIIFVIDSTDRNRFENVKYEFNQLINEEVVKKTVPFLIFANKQDSNDRMTVDEISKGLGLEKLKDRTWFIQATDAIKGDGVFEGFEWLINIVK